MRSRALNCPPPSCGYLWFLFNIYIRPLFTLLHINTYVHYTHLTLMAVYNSLCAVCITDRSKSHWRNSKCPREATKNAQHHIESEITNANQSNAGIRKHSTIQHHTHVWEIDHSSIPTFWYDQLHFRHQFARSESLNNTKRWRLESNVYYDVMK